VERNRRERKRKREREGERETGRNSFVPVGAGDKATRGKCGDGCDEGDEESKGH